VNNNFSPVVCFYTNMVTDIPAQLVQTRIAEAYRELPEAMRRIADALMSDPLLGALWGIEVMSERAEVSVGTVVRFAKRLGYKGFSEFRDSLREACHARSGDAELELMEVPSDVFGTLAEVARRDGENLQRMTQVVDQATLAAALAEAAVADALLLIECDLRGLDGIAAHRRVLAAMGRAGFTACTLFSVSASCFLKSFSFNSA